MSATSRQGQDAKRFIDYLLGRMAPADSRRGGNSNEPGSEWRCL